MYINKMKILVKYALELDIESINTFDGYKGGDIISFKSPNIDHLKRLKRYCHGINIDTNIKKDKNSDFATIFCAFGNDITLDLNDDLNDFKSYSLK
jgi:hypothetical protein